MDYGGLRSQLISRSTQCSSIKNNSSIISILIFFFLLRSASFAQRGRICFFLASEGMTCQKMYRSLRGLVIDSLAIPQTHATANGSLLTRFPSVAVSFFGGLPQILRTLLLERFARLGRLLKLCKLRTCSLVVKWGLDVVPRFAS